ncbi:hypothetical protein OV203_02500 [Nannocystis sp. ILAH1]|uniref:terminase large subunit domain-containing protein n=1 Tax=Nannocystis sp. ILAH1 TaxID=2996789 RepID=UPI00226DB882|nr:terminase family protein [Nannocystis sp. ILAH1]MCY0985982.1 hypothetical protein [Nannocystis sp. ILAH1]
MTLSIRQNQARKMDEVRAALARPQFVHIIARILVHEPAPSGSRRCPCCGSTAARVAEEIDDGEVLIHRTTGRRIRREQLQPATWDKAVAIAERHEVKLRVSRVQLPLLVDDSDRHILCAGSHRSGKTTLAVLWTVRQWIRRGGRRLRFWFIGETHDKAFEMVKTVFEGDGIAPPILPTALAVRRPATHKAADLNTIMLDGSLWQIRRFNSDPTAGGLKSRPIVAGCTDEAAEMKHPNALTALKGRCIDLRGRLFLATSPVGGSFLKPEIVEQCEEWDRMPADHPARANGEHTGARWISANLSMIYNPWLDPEAVRRDTAAQDPDSPSFKRDYLGLWVSNGGRLWRFTTERHVFIHEARRVLDMLPLANQRAGCPQRRVTDDCVRRIFQTRENPSYRGMRAANSAYILGGDVNISPQSTVVCEVTADAKDSKNRDRWHLWVFDVLRTFKGHAMIHADMLASTAWARAWGPLAKVSPFKGCGIVLDAQAFLYEPTAHRYGGDPQGLAELFGDRGFDARAPQYRSDPSGTRPVNPGRRESHMLIHRLIEEGRFHVSQFAMPLVKGLMEQEAEQNGVTPVKNDVLASAVDAVRYAAWAIFHGGHESIS